MFRLALFAAIVITYCGLSTGCCCCSDFMKGFNQGLQKGIKQAQEEQEAERKRQEAEAKKLLEQQNKDKDKNKPAFEYVVKTGQFTFNGQPIGNGFSGTGAARNNPAMTSQLKTGPIPQGDWRVSGRRNDIKTGELIIDLQIFTGANVKGRMPGENFTIHAENAPNAGESGIAAPRDVRDRFQVENILRVDTR